MQDPLSGNSRNSMLRIFIHNINAQVRIGIFEHEKQAPQKILVSIALYADPVSYLDSISQDTILNYAPLYEKVKSWETRSHVKLIETYLKELLATSFEDTRVMAAEIRIGKPDILPGAENAGVEIFMQRSDFERLQKSI